MGLRNLRALRSFCLELSTDDPSPGGGTAAAASGAMAASLLVMVCGITSRSKKHAANKKELEVLGRGLRKKRDELILLARRDAEAYEMVVAAMRRAREKRREETLRGVQKALKHAAEVPLETSKLCIDVLEDAVRIADLGKRSASSDVGVGTYLAYVGYKGAAMNVRINLSGLASSAFVKSTDRRLALLDDCADSLMASALRILQRRQN